MSIKRKEVARLTGLPEQVFKKKKLQPGLLNNDHQHYQRPREESRVFEIMGGHEVVRNFDKYQKVFGKAFKDRRVIAAKRTDGSYWIINGQHHAEAAIRWSIDKIPVWVFTSSGWESEKAIYTHFQKMQKG